MLNDNNNAQLVHSEYLKKFFENEIQPIEKEINFDDKNKYHLIEFNENNGEHLNMFLQQVPNLLSQNQLSKAYIMKNSLNLFGNLMTLNQGGYGSNVMYNGKIQGSVSFHPVDYANFYGMFAMISAATGQYYLHNINKNLKMLNLRVEKILEFLYGDKRAELMAELSFVKYVLSNFESILIINDQKLATLTNVQNTKKVAMKNIEFYINDLESRTNAEIKGVNSISDYLKDINQIVEGLEFAMQLYVIACILEINLSGNYKNDYLNYVEQDLNNYVSKTEKRLINKLSQVTTRVKEYKPGLMEKLETKDKELLTSDLEQKIELLASENISPLQKIINETMAKIKQEKSYYLTAEGNLYIKI